MSPFEQVACEWRQRAAALDCGASDAREAGDQTYAEELERAAVDYIATADALELGLEVPFGEACAALRSVTP